MAHPISNITLWLTDQCNLNCSYCYVKKSDTRMTAETARKAIDYFYSQPGFDDRTLQIAFFGGEPLLSFDIIEETAEYCSFLHKQNNRKYRLALTTNGTRFNENNLGFLKKNRFTVMISRDGSEEMHNKRRPFTSGNGSFQKVSEGISMAKQYLGKVDIRYTVEPEDENLAHHIFSMLDEKVRSLIFSPVLQADWNEVHQNGKLLSEFKLLGDRIIEELKKGKMPALHSLASLLTSNSNGYLSPKKCTHPCHAGLSGATVSQDGFITPCKHLKHLKEWEIGSIYEGIDESKRQAFIKLMEQPFPFCHNCSEIHICSGPCIADLILYSGSYSKQYLPYCLFIKNWQKMARYIHSKLSIERNFQFNQVMSQYSPNQQCIWQ